MTMIRCITEINAGYIQSFTIQNYREALFPWSTCGNILQSTNSTTSTSTRWIKLYEAEQKTRTWLLAVTWLAWNHKPKHEIEQINPRESLDRRPPPRHVSGLARRPAPHLGLARCSSGATASPGQPFATASSSGSPSMPRRYEPPSPGTRVGWGRDSGAGNDGRNRHGTVRLYSIHSGVFWSLQLLFDRIV
jgi:hypothetical protein